RGVGWREPARKSDPDVVDRGPLAAFVSGIQHAARLDQKQLDLVLRERLVLDSFRNHEHLSCRDMHATVAEVDSQPALEDDESLIRILVIVPDEVALQLDDLELIVVHLGYNLRLPLLAEQSELLPKVDRVVVHSVSPATSSGACVLRWVLRKP